MEEQSQKSIGDGLREIATWFDLHSEIKKPWVGISLDPYPSDTAKERLAAAAIALAPCEKSVGDWYVRLSRRFGPIELTISMDRDAICKKVVTWDCPDSLLSVLGKDVFQQMEADDG